MTRVEASVRGFHAGKEPRQYILLTHDGADDQQATRDYVARRTAEGKTGREIKRCLARYVARDLYRLLETVPLRLDEA